MNVLQTPIERALDDDRPRTILASDLHIPQDGGPALEKLCHLLEFAATEAARTRVLLLGDLYDWYVGIRQLRLWRFGAVADALAKATSAGVSVTLLHGNRDYMLDRDFAARTGVRVVPGGLRLKLGALDVLNLHGDELLLRDLPYQRSKRWLRSAWFRFLLRTMPLSWAVFLAHGARKQSKVSVRSGDQERFAPMRQAVDQVSALGVDLLVFGHIHKRAQGHLPGGGEYRVLPAFDEAGVFLLHEGDTLRYVDPDGRPLDDAPALEFPSQ